MDNITPAFNLVHSIVGNGHRAQRHAPMTATGNSKYYTVHKPLSDAQIAAHLTGSATYAVPLIGTDDLASAGLIEQDSGGMDMACRILAAAEARGVVMFSIVVKGSGGHDGSHNWALFDGRYNPKDIRAQLRQIAEDAGASTDEIHPNNTNIRLPLGVHLRSKTRGRLVLQSGETFELDTDLDAAERALVALPLNGQPPALPEIFPEVKPIISQRIDTLTITRTATGSIDTRAIAAATRKRFNQETTWPNLLEQYGGVEKRGGWACNCGVQHTHDVQIAVTSQDKIVSFSPNCTWAPQKGSGKALDKFGFYVDRAHSGRYMAAVEAKAREYGLWVEPKATPNTMLGVEPARYTDEQRAAYNAARKEKRHQETRESLDALYTAACNLDMSDRAHLLFVYLLGLCYERGVLQIAPTNEQISTDLDMCRRYVQYAFRELETAGIGKRQGGRNVEGNEAAVWTFYRSPNLGCKPHQDAECTLDIYDLDLIPDQLDLVSGGAPATLDEWEWQDDGHGADELSAVEMFAENANIAEPEAEQPSVAEMTERARRAFVARFATESKAAPDECIHQGGASYTPVELSDRPYTGRWKWHMSHEMRLDLARETMRLREQPEGTVNLLTLGDADADDPMVRVAPTDPKLAREYWQLKNKKASSAKQAIWMRRRIRELEVLVPLSEWQEQPKPGGRWLGGAASQAPNRAQHAQAVLL